MYIFKELIVRCIVKIMSFPNFTQTNEGRRFQTRTKITFLSAGAELIPSTKLTI